MFNFWGAYHLRVLTETSTTHSLLHFYYSKIRGVGWGLSMAESLQLGIVMYLYTIKIK